jgi:hypothetical protein
MCFQDETDKYTAVYSIFNQKLANSLQQPENFKSNSNHTLSLGNNPSYPEFPAKHFTSNISFISF